MIIIDGMILDDGADPYPDEIEDTEDEESGSLNAEMGREGGETKL